MYRIVWIFFVWSIAVSLSYFFNNSLPQIISIIFGLPTLYKPKDTVEITILWLALFITFFSLFIETWNQILYIYSIVISSVYLVCLVRFACKTNDHTKEGFNKKLRNEYIVKALSASTLLFTSIIVAYTTELYSLIPSGLLPVCVIYIQTGCKSFATSIKSLNPTKKVSYQMSNQEQEHLFGINAL